MKHRKGGFTLTEMLTVVGILAVLLAVAIPAIITVRNNLKMRELDDTAREIFLAAQNSLTARQAAGAPLELGIPDANGNDCYWLSVDTDPGAMKTLLPTGSIEGVAASNHYMLWYNTKTATVLEVYYAENPMDENKVKQLTYSDGYSENGKADRRQDRIGYYNGNDLDRGDREVLLPPMLTVENTDELTVIITVPKAAEYAAAGVQLTVTAEELDKDGNVVAGHHHEFQNVLYDAQSGEATVSLDSLTEGNRFKDICPEINPGANIRVTAKLSRNPDLSTNKTYLSSSASATANSLFAHRTTSNNGDTLSIAYARHLQNLESEVSALDRSVSPKPDYHAVQTAEITWPNGAPQFRPIGNDKLSSYDGNGNEIANLRVDCNQAKKLNGDTGGGLFAYVKNAKLENIRLVDPVLTGNQVEHVGALAGILRESDVTNCQVYATKETAGITCAGHAGGMIGLAVDGYTITNCSASLPKIASSKPGAYIGGLIGYASVHAGFTGSVSNCYADTGWMSPETKKWAPDYGMQGNSAIIGGLIGGTYSVSSTNWVSDCYAVGWFNSGTGGTLVGKVQQGVTNISNCYNILQSNEGNHYDKNEGPITTLSDLTMTGANWMQNGPTTPYHEDICPAPYPYPMLKLRHYGDWPVQTVDGIKLFDGPKDENELYFIMVPYNKPSVEFYAQALNGDTLTAQKVSVIEMGPGLAGYKTLDPSGLGRTKITLDFDKNNKIPQVTYVDLKGDEFTLRVVVVRYDATVTLTGRNNDNDTITASSYAYSDGRDSVIDTLVLRSTAKTGTLTARLNVEPSLSHIKTELEKINTGAGEQFKVSATAANFANWENICNGDPRVTANGDPENGANILAPVQGADGNPDYYPTAGTDGKLAVTGVASGTAIVSACWAMDENLKAECEVRMEGARALILKAEADGTDSVWHKEKENYPYRLELIAEPKESIVLTFTPQLLNTNDKTGTYTWEIRGTSGTNFVSGPYSNNPQTNNGEWKYTLDDPPARNAEYVVTLTYENKNTGEKSVDFMTFTVYRAASKDVTTYQHIVLQNRGTGVKIPGTDGGQVEQIQAEWNGKRVDQITLEGYVDGAQNTRVRWLAEISPDVWVPVTGVVGAQTVRDSEGQARATVEWVSTESTLITDGKTATGGAIRVTGLDVNEYGDPFPVNVRAEAMESAGDGNAPSSKTVTVNVMPKLEITPKSKTIVAYSGSQQSCKFTVNRSDDAYDYIWTTKIGDEVTSAKPGGASETINGVVDETVMVTCTYGPFSETASFKWRRLLDAVTAPINADYVDDNGTEYFIIEKNKIRELELTWGSLLSYSITTEPSGTIGGIEIGLNPGGSREPVGHITGFLTWEYVGERTYRLTGKEYTDDNLQELKWKLKWSRVESEFSKYFAVVGMEIDEDKITHDIAGNEVRFDGNRNLVLTKGQSADLKGVTTTSFAEHLKVSETLTWESDHPELVAVDENTGVITAVKNGAATYSATITAAYEVVCVNGKTYTYHDHITVRVEPAETMSVDLQPCTTVDVKYLEAAFGKNPNVSGVLVPVEYVDGNPVPVLINNTDFGCNTMYLKATAKLDGVDLDDLSEYISKVTGDEFYLKIDVPNDDFYNSHPECRDTLYIQVQAQAANAVKTELDLTAEIGTASITKTIYLYETPSVKLTLPNNQDVTNGSTPVFSAADLPGALTAQLVPTVYSYGDESKMPLDSIAWVLQASTGYDPGRYLTADTTKNPITISLKDTNRMPDFRVVLRAYSQKGGVDSAANAGYALVFLPEQNTP